MSLRPLSGPCVAGLLLALHSAIGPSAAAAEKDPLVVSYLMSGRLQDGQQALQQHLQDHPDDSQARYSLGVVQILQAVERLGQSLHQHGLRPAPPQIPFLRLPVPPNEDPEPITYDRLHGIFQTLIDDLDRAAGTLSEVDVADVKLRLPVGLIRLDLDGDGDATDEETFWRVFTTIAWGGAELDEEQRQFPIAFDQADVHWMIGYTHLLRAMLESYLAHDSREFFEATSPIFFANVETPHAVLGRKEREPRGFDEDQIADLIAAIHLVRWEPTEPERMHRAREHLLAMITHSRRSWEAVRQETDDDREWIPGADQTSVMPLEVNIEQVAAWQGFLDEAEKILQGELLVPHWRVHDGRGINLRHVFEKPRKLDLVMWVHGAAAVPYLQEGERTSQATWTRLMQTFQGRFLLFAVWFN